MAHLLETMRKLNPTLQAEVAAIFKKHGLDAKFGRGTFGESAGEIKLQVSVAGTSLAAEEYKRSAIYFGLKPEWLGKTFTHGGKNIVVKGLQPTKRKYPVEVSVNGKNMLYTVDGVRAGFGEPRLS